MAKAKAVGEDNLIVEELPEEMTVEERLAELEAQLAAEQTKNAMLQEKVDSRKGEIPGWIVEAPNPLFNGKTAGVRFTNGVAFVPGEDENTAKYLCDDFGYTRRFVENYLEEPMIAQEVGNSLAELVSPQIMR